MLIPMRTLSGTAIAMAVLMSGCASQPAVKPVMPEGVTISLKLVASADRIGDALQQLAEVQQFEARGQSPLEPRIVKQVRGMEQVITVPAFQGSIEPVVARMAAHVGFDFKISGRRPALPILVQLGPEPRTVSDHLRDVGFQAGQLADVVVDADSRVVELRYNNAL